MFGSNANTMNSNNDTNGDHNDENKDANNSFSIPESEIELDVRKERREDKMIRIFYGLEFNRI